MPVGHQRAVNLDTCFHLCDAVNVCGTSAHFLGALGPFSQGGEVAQR